MIKYKLIGILLIYSGVVVGQANLSNDTLHWNSSRPLIWDDFSGEVIEGIGLNGEAFCMNFANFNKPNVFQKTKFNVVAVFDRTKSWINADFKSDQGLLYFQVMFNIYEVHARSLRKDLAESKFGADPTALFQEKYNTSMTNLSHEFNAFRKETKMGSDAEALSKWKLKVEEELQLLDNYQQ